MDFPAWYNILTEVGYPTNVLVLDMETYFDSEYALGKGKMPTIEYIMDDRYEEHGVAVLHIPGEFPFTPPEARFFHDVKGALGFWQHRYGDNLKHCTVVVFNGRFDGTILARRYNITPPFVVDVLDLARHVNSRQKNSLAALCERYGLPAKGDTAQFKGLHWDAGIYRPPSGPPTRYRGMTDDEKGVMWKYACNDVEREFDLFAMLLPLLTRPEFELPLARHTHGLYWLPKIAFDFAAADQLIEDMTIEIDAAADRVGLSQKELRGNISFVKILGGAMDPHGQLPEFKVRLKKAKFQYTRGEMEPDRSVSDQKRDQIRAPMLQATIKNLSKLIADRQVPMKVGKPTKSNPTGMIPAFAKTDEAMIRLKEHPDERVRNLVEARQAVKSWPLHIKRVKNMSAQARAAGGRLSVPLLFCGAHTGRWSGGEGINLQNLAARNAHRLVLRQRGLLVPPDGYVFVIADASQVEARGTGWVAGQDDLLADFEAGVQIYCQFASEILGKKVRKARSTDPTPVAKYLIRCRQMGKVGILGAGYGMGADKCQVMAKNSYQIDLTFPEAKKIIDHYRTRYSKIPKFWYRIEKAFKFATRYPNEGPCILDQGLVVYSKDNCTFIVLPSGRQLRYEGAKVVGTGRDEHIKVPNPRQKNWTHVWGGYICENIVQAICRDLLAEAILDLERRGIQIGLHCHDEIIAVVPATEAELAVEVVLEAMCKRPSWATTFPLDAEAVIAERYGK